MRVTMTAPFCAGAVAMGGRGRRAWQGGGPPPVSLPPPQPQRQGTRYKKLLQTSDIPAFNWIASILRAVRRNAVVSSPFI